MNEILVREIPLPYAIAGMTATDENGDYNVYINSKLPREKKLEAFQHELSHIRDGHFNDDRPVDEKEREVNGKSTKTKIRKLEHPSL